MQENIKTIIKLGMAALTAYAVYELFKTKSPEKALKKTIEKPLKVAEEVSDVIMNTTKSGLKYFKKGSQEAKDHMSKLRSMKKGGKKKPSNSKKKKDRINAKIKMYEDKAIKAYEQEKMKLGKRYEEKADKLYKDYYSILHPKLHKKMLKLKEKKSHSYGYKKFFTDIKLLKSGDSYTSTTTGKKYIIVGSEDRPEKLIKNDTTAKYESPNTGKTYKVKAL